MKKSSTHCHHYHSQFALYWSSPFNTNRYVFFVLWNKPFINYLLPLQINNRLSFTYFAIYSKQYNCCKSSAQTWRKNGVPCSISRDACTPALMNTQTRTCSHRSTTHAANKLNSCTNHGTIFWLDTIHWIDVLLCLRGRVMLHVLYVRRNSKPVYISL